MKLKYCFLFLLLAVLLIPAELKPKKHEKKDKWKKRHRHRHHDHRPEHHLRRKDRFKDIIEDPIFAEISGPLPDDDEDDDDINEWLYEIQEPEGPCGPDSCFNGGVCRPSKKKKFKCDCPKPFRGRRCKTGPKTCKKGLCGRGECVLTSTPPFYECKCKAPFQPPNCLEYSVCNPNPCQNGGICVAQGNDFDCRCPAGYKGQFCHAGPDDCFVDDGESYRGNVSETQDGFECLQWNSHFILDSGINPFTSFENSEGLGTHNFCRNPDGENMPWCFYRRGRKVRWDYCDVTECPGSTPTEVDQPQDSEESDSPVIIPPVTARPSKAPPTTARPTPARPTAPLVPVPTALAPEFSTCGKPQPRKRITRIFGGLKVAPGAIPWQVSLQVRPQHSNRPFKHICGGVLIRSCWVLTARHCIEPRQDMQVLLGSLALDFPDPDAQVLRVEEAIVHENYRETYKSVHNDIALLRLRGSDGVCARETQFVKAACLPDTPLPDGIDCTISGWGVNETGANAPTVSNHMLEANVLLINQNKCSEPAIYGTNLDDSMVCAGHLQGGVDSCQGDSGGPLSCKQGNSHVVYGLVSWGDQCGMKNKPGVYTRVVNFLQWINAKIQASTA